MPGEYVQNIHEPVHSVCKMYVNAVVLTTLWIGGASVAAFPSTASTVPFSVGLAAACGEIGDFSVGFAAAATDCCCDGVDEVDGVAPFFGRFDFFDFLCLRFFDRPTSLM